MDPISVAVTRGGVVEARHRVHAVAVQNGAVVEEVGSGDLVTHLRSCAKPLQALAVARAREDLSVDELAIAAASHAAEPAQIVAVRALLARAGATEADLEIPIGHNCSGEHAGMLALAAARGWPRAAYRDATHPVQSEILEVIAEAAAVRPDEVRLAVDGCGVPTHALPLERMAYAYSRLGELAGGDDVRAAMRVRPELIGGHGVVDTRVMQLLPGWIAKRGAEGLFCAAGPDGIGVALKVEDGSDRAREPALARFLGLLGASVGELAVVPVRDLQGETVGEIAVAG